MRTISARLLCVLFILRVNGVVAPSLDSGTVLAGATYSSCDSADHHCWDGYNCFRTDDTCGTGKVTVDSTYGGCGNCDNWNDAKGDLFCMSFVHLVGDPSYPQLPLGTTFSPGPTFGVSPYFIYRLSRYVRLYDWWTRTCQLWRARSIQITVTCPTGYYATISTATCSDGNNNSNPPPNLNWPGDDNQWHDDDCCYNCYSYIFHGHYCAMCATWDQMPYCQAGCLLPTITNGPTPSVTNAVGGLTNGVYRATAAISYTCNTGYYLSTLNVQPLSATCVVSVNNVRNWTVVPTCIPGCIQLTMAAGTGSVSYVPNVLNYSPTGYVAQTVLAIFNCSGGYYLDPANYTYNCTGPSGVWDLGSTAPVCRMGCPFITTFTNGQIVYTPTANLITGVYRWTSVATFNCSAGYYLSTLTSSSTTTDCNVTGSWTAIPQCLLGCPAITNFVHGQTIPYSPNTVVSGLYTQGTTTIINCSAGYYLNSLTTVNSSVCLRNGSWSFVPNCTIGCAPIPSLTNGNAIIYSPLTTTDNGVYRQNSFATFTCLNNYYLSTLTTSNSTDCCGSGSWSNIPTCLAACATLTLASGTISYAPAIPAYVSTGYVPQATLAIFNCSTNFYLDPANYVYNCTGPSWNLGSSAVCRAGCQNISFANGQVVYTPSSNLVTGVYRWTTVATFTCSTGYYLSTLTSSTTTDCNVTGSWTAIPQCLRGCPAVTTFTHGQTIPYSPNTIVNSLYTQGTTTIFNCSAGYYLTSLTTVNSSVCMGNGSWSFVSNCTIGCPPIPNISNGNAIVYSPLTTTDNGVYRQNSFATFSCLNNYYLSTLTTSNSTDCNGNGVWSNVPTCIAACATLTLASGTISYSPNIPAYMSTGYVPQATLAIFNCSTGFYLDPANNIYNCTGPSWNLGPSVPVCRAGCQNISFANGLVVYTPGSNWVMGVYRWTTVATFTCSTGYYLSTLTSTTTTDCNVTSSWTALPQCLPGCQPITTFANGQTIPYIPSLLVNSLYPQNTTAIFNCSAGYYLSTLTTVNSSICTGNGQWSFVPNCIIGCPDIGSFPNGNYTYTYASGTSYLDNSVYRQTTTATFTCNSQYFLSTSTLSTTTDCNSSGGWTSIPTCTLGCLANDTQLQITNGGFGPFVTALVSPINGYLYQTGDTVSFTCSGDNYLSSVSPAICGNGQWTGIPYCVAGCHAFSNTNATTPSYSIVSYSQSVSISNPLVYNEGTTANFTCYNGTYLGGLSSAVCQTNGTWSNQPICLAGCFAAPTITNMDTITYTIETVPTPILHVNATIAHYTCKALYQMTGTDTITCLYGNWTYPLPSCNAIPLALTLTKAAMTLSCTFLVIALGAIIGVTILIRDFSIETCLHLSEDFALFFAHLLILIFLTRVDLPDLCPAASAGIQYFITTSFLGMMVEAIHSFALLQNIISFGGVFDYTRLKNFVIGWFGGMIPTGITIAMRYENYPSTYSCYVNLGDEISLYIMGPILITFLVTLILTEAAAMREWKLLPLVSRQQVVAAHVNQKAMAILVFLSLGSWFFGLLASYVSSPFLFSIGAGVNTAFGVAIIIFHFIGNPKLNNWFHQKVLKKCCKKKQHDP